MKKLISIVFLTCFSFSAAADYGCSFTDPSVSNFDVEIDLQAGSGAQVTLMQDGETPEVEQCDVLPAIAGKILASVLCSELDTDGTTNVLNFVVRDGVAQSAMTMSNVDDQGTTLGSFTQEMTCIKK